MGTEGTVAQHYTHGPSRVRCSTRPGAGKDPDRLEPGDLAPVDEFHIGGRQATVDFAAELRVTRGMLLLETPQKIANMVSVIEAGLISPTEIICRAGG